MSCINCYKLTVAGVEGTYTLQKRTSGNVWFKDDTRVVDTTTITTLFSLVDTEVKRANSEVLCTARQETITLTPYGLTYTNETGVITPPSSAKSITIMVEPSTASRIEVSFDGGGSWTLELRKREVKTWSDESSFIDLSNVRIRPKGASATFDIHGEK